MNLESGLNVEHAFRQALMNLESGRLKSQGGKILSLCGIGFSFGQALKKSLSQFQFDQTLVEILENILLALKLGSPLIKILQHLSFHFRIQASSRLEVLANEAPIKMIFPLVIFIFPVIFILLGSGAIENLIRSFHF